MAGNPGRLSRPPPTCRHLGQRSGRIPALPYPLPKRFSVYPILAFFNSPLCRLPFSSPLRIIQRPCLQHRYQHRQPTIRHSPCRSPVTVASLSQRRIMLLRCGILLRARAQPSDTTRSAAAYCSRNAYSSPFSSRFAALPALCPHSSAGCGNLFLGAALTLRRARWRVQLILLLARKEGFLRHCARACLLFQ
jgi:hypothetical protein